MKKHDLTNTHLHRASPGKALYATFAGMTMAAMLCQPVFAATVWEKANEIMKEVTHVYKGIVYIRLSNGANAIAHSCYDRRRPGRKDDVSFVVTHLDEERGVAAGIITRIIKQYTI